MLECSFYVIDCQSSYIFPCTCTNSCFSCCRLSKLYLLQLKTNKTQKKWTTFVNVSSERVNRISIFFVASPILFYFCNKFIFSFRVPNVIKINLDVVCCSLLLLLFFRCRYSFYSGNGTIVVPSLSTVRFILFKKNRKKMKIKMYMIYRFDTRYTTVNWTADRNDYYWRNAKRKKNERRIGKRQTSNRIEFFMLMVVNNFYELCTEKSATIWSLSNRIDLHRLYISLFIFRLRTISGLQ